MANRKLRIVDELPRAVYIGTDDPITIKDRFYPRKSEVRRGSVFEFHGHSVEEPVEYIVEDIFTLQTSESGRAVEASVHNVRLLDDIVILRCEKPFMKRRMRFRWLSISAAWRLSAEEK
jgi:hypothetical protein